MTSITSGIRVASGSRIIPDWVRVHHPEWARNGDWDKHHHWHDRNWWKEHYARWTHEHYHDWF
jgi:hypothetical protein